MERRLRGGDELLGEVPLLRAPVAVGHHDHHRLGVAVEHEVVEDLLQAAQFYPLTVALAVVLQEVERGVRLGAIRVVARRGPDERLGARAVLDRVELTAVGDVGQPLRARAGHEQRVEVRPRRHLLVGLRIAERDGLLVRSRPHRVLVVVQPGLERAHRGDAFRVAVGVELGPGLARSEVPLHGHLAVLDAGHLGHDLGGHGEAVYVLHWVVRYHRHPRIAAHGGCGRRYRQECACSHRRHGGEHCGSGAVRRDRSPCMGLHHGRLPLVRCFSNGREGRPVQTSLLDLYVNK